MLDLYKGHLGLVKKQQQKNKTPDATLLVGMQNSTANFGQQDSHVLEC